MPVCWRPCTRNRSEMTEGGGSCPPFFGLYKIENMFYNERETKGGRRERYASQTDQLLFFRPSAR